MKLVVCALDDVSETARRHSPDGVVSLLAEDHAPPAIISEPPRLVLRVHDIAAPQEGLTAPSAEAVEQLLAFAAGPGARETLLLHCVMGVSRSPAAAFILACAASPATPEEEVALALRSAAPFATPNPLLVSLADRHLRRRGRMVAAISRIGRGCDCARGVPFILDTALLDSLWGGAA